MAATLCKWSKIRVPIAIKNISGGTVGLEAEVVSHRSCWRGLATSPSPAERIAVPTEADVVVIGGGSLGCNTLYHLAKLGITNTVLLEAHKLTSGTTWHTAGLLWELRNHDTDIHLIHTTRNVLLKLEDETGISPGWINNGGLMIAEHKDRLDGYKRVMSLGRTQGIETHVLDPGEMKELHPHLDVEGLVGGLYSPRDGTMDPTGLCMALTRSAERGGAKVLEDCPVTDIRTEETFLGGRKVTEVHTPYGVIKTNAVVNASGSWGNYIANMVGLELPLMVVEHAMAYTEKIPGIENTPNVRIPTASAVVRLQGDSLAVAGFESSPVVVNEVAKDSPFMLYDLRWDIFGELLERSIERIPALGTAGIKSTISGPESFTPDGKPLLGEDPNIQGFFHCCGGNGGCMMLGGGIGDQLAKWIVHGRPELDMFGYDIRRFYAPLTSKRNWVIPKCHESGYNWYSVKYAHSEPLAGRGQRLSPLHEILESQGCVFQERHGWERPGWFNPEPCPVQPYDWYGAYGTTLNSDQRYPDALKCDHSFELPSHHELLKKECLSCRNGAAIFDLSDTGKFYLTGPDAQKAADWIFSANVNRDPGIIIYTCMLNQRGGIEANINVSVCSSGDGSACNPSFEGRGFYITTDGPYATQTLSHLMKEVRSHKWNVQVSNHTDDLALLSVQGPKSRDILQSLTDNADFSNEAFPVSTHKIVRIIGHKVRACRETSTGELGWELHMSNASAVPVYRSLMAAGKSLGLINAGYRALESLSCEKGDRHWHADIRPDDTPLEAGLAFTCKLDSDTNFLGREALERQKVEGVTKKIVTFTLDDPARPLWGMEGIWRDGEPVGFIRRAGYAYTLGRAIGYGYVQCPDRTKITDDFLETGTWKIESLGVQLDATIHFRPPFDPENIQVEGN